MDNKSQKQLIIYGLGKRGKIYYNFFKEKGLDGCIKGFCDSRYLELGGYDGKRCYGYDEAKAMKIPFLISIKDPCDFSEIEVQVKQDGNKSYKMDNIADYLEKDKVVFNRDFVAFFHVNDMENYFKEAEETSIRFWALDSYFYKYFNQLDLSNVIELACGRGRHVLQYIDKAESITLVDILEKNINICRERFKTCNNIHYYCNNGFNLEQLLSNTYTALFSYDAMVHFEMLDIYEYLKDIHRVLRGGGRALIHHSNYDGDYTASFINAPHGRSYMNANIFSYLSSRCGFRILDQRIIPWGEYKQLDCITLLEK